MYHILNTTVVSQNISSVLDLKHGSCFCTTARNGEQLHRNWHTPAYQFVLIACVSGQNTTYHCNYLYRFLPHASRLRAKFAGQNSDDIRPIRRPINSRMEVFPEALIIPTEGLRYLQRGHVPPFADPYFIPLVQLEEGSEGSGCPPREGGAAWLWLSALRFWLWNARSLPYHLAHNS